MIILYILNIIPHMLRVCLAHQLESSAYHSNTNFDTLTASKCLGPVVGL